MTITMDENKKNKVKCLNSSCELQRGNVCICNENNIQEIYHAIQNKYINKI